MKKLTDTQLLDWLETKEGFALISDDAGRWAVSGSGTQNVVGRKMAGDVMTTFFVEAREWRKTVRAAIMRMMERLGETP